MTRGGTKALWALGLLAGAAGVGTAIYFVTKPKLTPDQEQPNANLPPGPPPAGGGGGGEGGGGGGGGGGGVHLPNPLDPLGIYTGIYNKVTGKG